MKSRSNKEKATKSSQPSSSYSHANSSAMYSNKGTDYMCTSEIPRIKLTQTTSLSHTHTMTQSDSHNRNRTNLRNTYQTNQYKFNKFKEYPSTKST